VLIDRTHKSWFVASVLLVVVAAVAYWVGDARMPHGVTGGSVLGLWFGIVGSLCMVFAALLAVRKRLPTWRVGSAQFWLRAHLWLGSVGFLLILLHSGFRWGGPLEQWMWWAFGLVVLTGWIGVELQQIVPRLLTTRVPLETMVDQIPFLSQTMLFRADQLVAKVAGVLDVEHESLKPFAKEVLKQQRVLKRESDFPKELAKVYAGIELPADENKPHAVAAAPSAKPAPAPAAAPAVSASSPTADAAPAAKPKSPLELMREKAAAKEASGTAPTTSAPATDAATSTATTEKKLSPLEQMKAKLAAAKEASGTAPTTSAPATDAVTSTATTEKKLSPLEQMKAKLAAAKPAATEAADAPPQPLKMVKAADGPTPMTEEKSRPPVVNKPTAASVEKPVSKPVAPAPLAASRLAELRQFHVGAVRPFLSSGRSPKFDLHKPIAARRWFSQLQADLPPELHETLQELNDLCEERRQFNTQLRLHRWLQAWLIFHIPPSIALLVLFVAHVLMALRVVPFGNDPLTPNP
jgi:hypothetical protein